MKVLIQWAKDIAEDWIEIDSSDWASLPKKDDPIGIESVDAQLGWINCICIQGVEFRSDHYAIQEMGGGAIRVYSWNNNDAGLRSATIFEFHPLAPDLSLGGAINTRQFISRFYENRDSIKKDRAAKTKNLTLNTWKNFIHPPKKLIRHGKLLEDNLYEEHENIREIRGWREWTEGLPIEELENGKLRDQRKVGKFNKPDGTKTYYQSATSISAVHNPDLAANKEKSLVTAAEGSSSLSSAGLGVGAGIEIFSFTTESTQPNAADWPEGNYRCQIDVTAVGGDLSYGPLKIQYGPIPDNTFTDGHFGRVDSGISADQEKHEGTTSFGTGGGTGLKLSETGTVTWTSPSTSERFEILYSMTRADLGGMGSAKLTIQIGVNDSFADGPWELEDSENSIFFGMNF